MAYMCLRASGFELPVGCAELLANGNESLDCLHV